MIMELRSPKLYNWQGLVTRLKAGRHKTEENLIFLYESEGRERPVSQLRRVWKFPASG